VLRGRQRYMELKPRRSERNYLSKSLHSLARRLTTTQQECTLLVSGPSWRIVKWFLEDRGWWIVELVSGKMMGMGKYKVHTTNTTSPFL